MKREDKSLIEKFEIYKKFIEGRIIEGCFRPIERESDLTSFLIERYGKSIKGQPVNEMFTGQKYSIAKREAKIIINELNLDVPQRRILIEGILEIKKHPHNTNLYNTIVEAAREASYEDIIQALGGLTYREPEQLTLGLQNRKTY